MVTMSNVWDRAVDVIRGRTGQLATIAFLTLFLPNLLSAAVAGFAPDTSLIVTRLVLVAVAAIGMFGGLAMVSTATDPDVDTLTAFHRAGQRFLPALGIKIVLGLAVGVLLIPVAGLIAASGLDLAALRPGGAATAAEPARPGLLALALFLAMALAVVVIWVSARLVVLNPVIVNERHGLGAIGRSWALTRGLVWRILGVLVLFAIVAGISLLAVTSVVGLAARLAVGPDQVGAARFIATAAGGVVAAAYAVVQAVFVAQLYVAVTDRRVTTVFE